jgi:putative aldouronate transport system substrate-binding protein
MKHFKVISLIIVIAMLVGIVSACSKEKEQGTTTASTTTTQKATTTTAAAQPTTTEKVIPNFNPDGFPIVNEPITLTMLSIQPASMIDDWSQHKFFQRSEEITGIKFIFNNVPTDVFNERKQLGWASGDLPDLFFKAVIGTEEELIYGEEGLLLPINDLIDQYAPNIQYLFQERPDVRQAITLPSGNIYTLPQVGAKSIHPAWYINVVWLDTLGVDMPTNPGELYYALKMIKEGDPNQNNLADEVPMLIQNTTRQVREFMENFGITVDPSGLQYVDYDTGTVKYGPIQPEFKEALFWFRKVFADGLLAVEPQARAKELGHNYQLGLARMDASWVYVGYENEYNMEYEVIVPFEVNGRRIALGTSGITRGCTAITNKNQYPEATIRWLDYLYSVDGMRLLRFGEEGEDWRWRGDGTWEVILKEGETSAQKMSYTSIQPGGQLSWWSDHPVLQEWWKKVYSDAKDNFDLMTNRLLPYYYTPYPAVTMREDTIRELADLRGTLNTYVNDMMTKFIYGEASIETEWDSYVKQIYDMGVEQLLRIYQEAYDALVD